MVDGLNDRGGQEGGLPEVTRATPSIQEEAFLHAPDEADIEIGTKDPESTTIEEIRGSSSSIQVAKVQTKIPQSVPRATRLSLPKERERYDDGRSLRSCHCGS
ncbi:hypothetical protein SO802_005958 [Lithocarpus litseifolius]|uniref:Uncharacterized protein n=1 Tax=Lithocarpus litseifolius TaxID=425828 RepID=A0AAW2DNG7_9ROSI